MKVKGKEKLRSDILDKIDALNACRVEDEG